MTIKLAIDGGEPVHKGEPIPLSKPSYGWEELLAILEVFRAGTFCSISSDARKVKELEAFLSEFIGTKHVIAFSSGANAQHASLIALNLGPGDEVIVPSSTFISTAYTVLLQNAVPVFADINIDTFTLDPTDVRRKITTRTKAIVPVHWFGVPADMDNLLEIAHEHDIAVIEDCAHAIGTIYKGQKAGTMGVMACWSMQESKLITSAGDGGFLTTDNDTLAERARIARDHGRIRLPSQPYSPTYSSYNSIGNHYRLTEIQAAFALAQFQKLKTYQQLRRQHTEFLDSFVMNIDGLRLQAREGDIELSYAYYPVRFLQGQFSQKITQIVKAFVAEGIGVYPYGFDEMCHTQPLFTQRRGRGNVNCPFDCMHFKDAPKYEEVTLPNSELLAEELIALPLYPDLTQKDLEDIICAVEKVVEAYKI